MDYDDYSQGYYHRRATCGGGYHCRSRSVVSDGLVPDRGAAVLGTPAFRRSILGSSHLSNAITAFCGAFAAVGVAVLAYWDTVSLLMHLGDPVIGAIFVPMLVPPLQLSVLVVTAVVAGRTHHPRLSTPSNNPKKLSAPVVSAPVVDKEGIES